MRPASFPGRPYVEAPQRRQNSVAQGLHAAIRKDAARGVVVNRTHRVVREQALNLREQRRKLRGLWIPLTICSMLLITSCYAIWGVMDASEVTSIGLPDASDQLMLFLLWSLPVTAAILGLAWFRRGRVHRLGDGARNDSEVQP
ncbi:MAG: hypothetical protein ACP5E5_03455 [Acidobacteriaceae bacterium]